MARQVYEDKSYIEISKSSVPNKLFVTVAAKSSDDAHKLIVNSIELTETELLTLIKSAS